MGCLSLGWREKTEINLNHSVLIGVHRLSYQYAGIGANSFALLPVLKTSVLTPACHGLAVPWATGMVLWWHSLPPLFCSPRPTPNPPITCRPFLAIFRIVPIDAAIRIVQIDSSPYQDLSRQDFIESQTVLNSIKSNPSSEMYEIRL